MAERRRFDPRPAHHNVRRISKSAVAPKSGVIVLIYSKSRAMTGRLDPSGCSRRLCFGYIWWLINIKSTAAADPPTASALFDNPQ